MLARRALLREASRQVHLRHSLASLSPCPMGLVQLVTRRLDQLLQDDDVVADIGCGDGRWLRALCERKEVRCVGVDCDPSRIALARAALSQRAELVCGDFLCLDYSLVTVAVLYLSCAGNTEVRDRVLSTCPDLRLVVAAGFAIDGWQAQETLRCDGMSVYLYVR